MSPSTILSILIITASIVGAKLYTGHELKKQNTADTPNTQTQNYITALETQLSQLEKENQTLRDLATSGANTTLPAELIDFVQKDIGLEFKTPPLIRTTTQDSIAEAAGQRYLAAFSESGMQMRAYAFETIGIIPINQNLINQLIIAETNGSRGYFDLTSSEILLAPDFDPENIHHLASAARLLAIALLDQHSPLPMTLTDDQFHAREAIHRGRAAMLQTRFYTINARQIGFVSEKPNTEAIETFQALAPYIQDLTTFPNTHGKTFTEILYQKSKDTALQALITPPKTTLEILTDTLPQNFTTPQELIPSQTTPLATRLGAITIRSYLAQVLDEKPTDSLIKEFLIDSLNITTSGPAQATTTITWTTTWKTPQAAKQFNQAANDIAASLETPPSVKTDGATTTITYEE